MLRQARQQATAEAQLVRAKRQGALLKIILGLARQRAMVEARRPLLELFRAKRQGALLNPFLGLAPGLWLSKR
jgi:hypothetical protein